MDWTMAAVYLFCAAFAIYVAGLLTGLCYELTQKYRDVSSETPKSLMGARTTSPASGRPAPGISGIR
jgi:hypothetical protein